MRLAARLIDVADLTPSQRDEMFALMDRHYANVHRRTFEADLAEKRWVILLRDSATDRLCGFSTQVLLDATVAGRPVKVLFSGDTIVSREHWGDRALSHVWGRLALSLMDAHAGAELYWLLLSKGYRTYRFLPVFFHEFYPRHDAPTPPWARAVLDAVAGARYPEHYDAAAGIVRTSPWQYRLRDELAGLTPERLQDPHIHFFQRRNPGHARGDELCCLAPLTRENFTAAAYRVLGPEPARLPVP